MSTLAGHPYLTRAEWGARPPTAALVRIAMPTPRLWVHHSADDRQGAAAVRAHQKFHQDTRGWKDLAYAYLIGNDGTIFEGRGHQWIGGATEGDNSRSQAICLLGNFQTYGPSPAQWRALVDLTRHGRDAGWWVPTCGGHRDAPQAQTACPGDHLYQRLPELRQAILLPATPPEDDMTPDQAKQLDAIHKALTGGGLVAAVDTRIGTAGSATRAGLHDLFARDLAAPSGRLHQATAAVVRAALDPKVFAAAVVAELPEGSTDVAAVEGAVERVLDRAYRAAADA